MAILVLGQKVLLPLFVDRSSLQGLHLFTVYQALIIPVWIAPFLGLLKGQNPSYYPSMSCRTSFACWAGLSSIPEFQDYCRPGELCPCRVFLVLTNTTFVRKLRLGKSLVKRFGLYLATDNYCRFSGFARSFDVWLVARHFDEAAFAIFRYGAREFPLVVAFAAGLSTIMIPKLRTSIALDELRERSTRLMHTCYPLVAVVMVFSPVLFAFFFGAAYKESALIFNIYLLITLTQLVFPQSVMTARGDTRWLWYISLAELAVNIIASLALLSAFGLAGIAMGTLIAFAFEKIVLTIFIYKRYGIHLARLINPSVWLAYALLIMCTFIAARWIFGI